MTLHMHESDFLPFLLRLIADSRSQESPSTKLRSLADKSSTNLYLTNVGPPAHESIAHELAP